ncbi:MAG: murein L,D-transpeptidase [Desulfatibacillum sp.]|nr:murein L,D-transpeptidase [Desulfatibacillum sp.]
MKRLAFILVFVLSILQVAAYAQEVPSSARSREVIARIKPGLEREFAAAGLTRGSPIFIRIFKKEKRLEVWAWKDDCYHHFKSYPICTYGLKGLGPKLKQGDWKAPEGFYFVTPSQMNPSSNYHLAFNLGYPNKYDRAHGRTGGLLMVHGNCVSIGCYAMRDKRIEEIYTIADAALRNGQPFFRVHIFPFEMTDKNMKKNKGNEWFSFWQNLKEGYDFFEENRKPPNVEVQNGKYIFSMPQDES